MIRSNDPTSFSERVWDVLREHESDLIAWAKRENDLFNIVDPDSIEGIFRENEWSEQKAYVLEELLVNELSNLDVTLLHYTRLLDHEVINIQELGMQPTSVDFLEKRLQIALEHSILTEDECARILEGSPLQNSEQSRARLGEVCFVSAPIRHSDNGIDPLLSHWGGEMAHFWLKDKTLKKKLGNIGQPIVIEASVRLQNTEDLYSYSTAILNCFLASALDWAENSLKVFHIKRMVKPSEIKRCFVEGSKEFGVLAEGKWP